MIKGFIEKLMEMKDILRPDNMLPHEKTIRSGNIQAVITEQYRLLRSRLNSLNGSHGNKVIAVTSTQKGEGKSITSVNLAIVMAEDTKKKVLLIDGDMRKPSIHTFFNCKSEYGLVDLLTNKIDIESVLIPSGINNLTILPAGKPVESPSDIVAAPQLKEGIERLKKKFDYIIVDSPPIMPFADMNILGDVVDGILLIVKAETTPKERVLEALKSLNKENIIGVVLNDSRRRPPKIYY